MSEIGKKIREVRMKKGLSQEELAETAKINLRTIQRIENNANEPRRKTLHLICEVLELNENELLDCEKEIDKSYIFFLHLSILSGLLIPMGNIILPLILWLSKKDDIKGLAEIGANLLNFQLIWTSITFLLIVTTAQLGFSFYIIAYLATISFIINITYAIICALKVKSGTTDFFYPQMIKLIK